MMTKEDGARFDRAIHVAKADLTKWMFLFIMGQFALLAGLAKWVLSGQ